jgi:lysophospholipase L1-like esterase
MNSRYWIGVTLIFALASFGCSDDGADDDNGGSSTAQDTATAGKADASGTAGGDASGALKLLVVGDSALAWNESKSTGHQLVEVLTERGVNATVKNNAVSGATMGCGENGVGDSENCIPPQYEAGDWTHVLMSGGANDIDAPCKLSADVLISDDLKSGLTVDAINKLTAAGHKVLLYRYFETLDPENPLNTCKDIQTLMARYAKLAASRDDVIGVDATVVVKRANAKHYAPDGMHPSPAGSRVIAEHIAKVLGY